MPVPANNIPVHHWSLLKAGLSYRLGGMGRRRIANLRKPDSQKDTEDHSN